MHNFESLSLKLDHILNMIYKHKSNYLESTKPIIIMKNKKKPTKKGFNQTMISKTPAEVSSPVSNKKEDNK